MLAFVFPGQGAQFAGMGRKWIDDPAWSLVARASEIVGRDVGDLLLNASDEALRRTRNTQLGVFVQSLVVLESARRRGLAPSVMAGHSLGEYTALVAAGVLEFDAGVELVESRGHAMDKAAQSRSGTMTSVLGLFDEDAEMACHATTGDVWVANYNAERLVVIAGASGAVRDAAQTCREIGARAVQELPVSGAFHTPLMRRAAFDLRDKLVDVSMRDAAVPVIANLDARVHHAAEEWPALLFNQVCSPVRYRGSITRMRDLGVTHCLEIGPGRSMTSLVRRTAPDIHTFTSSSPADLDESAGALLADIAISAASKGAGLSVRIPSDGVFFPAQVELFTSEGELIDAGRSIGRLAATTGTIADIRAPRRGFIEYLVGSARRVEAGQAVAIIR